MVENNGNERELAEDAAPEARADVEKRWARALEEAPTFGVAMGRRLEQAREEQGRSAEDVARSAQHYGLSWHRPTVRQIEQGKRALSAVELILLPLLYERPLADLLPERTIWLTPEVGVYGREVRKVLGGDYGPVDARMAPGGWHRKGWNAAEAMDQVLAIAGRVLSRYPAGALLKHMPDGSPDEAETKAAKRLGTSPDYVAYAARETWGHGLAAEREARLRERGDVPEGKRALQSARGHITRSLLAELEPVIRAYDTGREQREQDEAEWIAEVDRSMKAEGESTAR
ncbi:helix-turn-helix transcriptional regulator [Streptomyces sp. NPDC007861]|uniref:helix-turn-helix transcriptional regulator n=1 Tax=Streptomyces sp. NPDC007861 TaxID=3154893 RepID=UPI0033E01CC2